MNKNELEEVIVLVKALPHPSTKHGETVCCAGITTLSEWRRIFPVRFRQLSQGKFQRWDRLRYRWRQPTNDARSESRDVFEDTFQVGQQLSKPERSRLLEPLVRSSVQEAILRRESFALIRPTGFKFIWNEKHKRQIELERSTYAHIGGQKSFLDAPLTKLEPYPLEFRVAFSDASGIHNHKCEDWETTAAFWNLSQHKGFDYALGHLDRMYNHEYQENGMVLALGNMVSRPQTWLSLGVIRLDESKQRELF